MTFIFYDTETTGLKPAFDQILQFAAIVTDDSLQILEELNLRCRLQPHVLPSPGAMVVTGVGPVKIAGASLSCYEMIKKIRNFVEKWSPAVLTGFNSISYDESMLRQAFYQHLHPVYLTNTGGNTRFDILTLAHAVAVWQPDALSVPLNDKGRPTFRLSELVKANGLPMGDAHDAQADTRATIDLAKFLRDSCPDIWTDLFSCRSRPLADNRIHREKIFFFTDRAFKKPTIAAGTICASPDNPASYAVFDLEYDPATYVDVDLERAKKLLKANPRPIRILRTNSLPIVRSLKVTDELPVEKATMEARLRKIRNHPTFTSVIAEALAGQYSDAQPSVHIEEHIFGGFPDRADSALMEKFHAAPWESRYGICQGFREEKYRIFGERLIFAEYPDALPPAKKKELAKWCRGRHAMEDECGWMTKAKARGELEQLEKVLSSQNPALLAEMKSYFGV